MALQPVFVRTAVVELRAPAQHVSSFSIDSLIAASPRRRGFEVDAFDELRLNELKKLSATTSSQRSPRRGVLRGWRIATARSASCSSPLSASSAACKSNTGLLASATHLDVAGSTRVAGSGRTQALPSARLELRYLARSCGWLAHARGKQLETPPRPAQSRSPRPNQTFATPMFHLPLRVSSAGCPQSCLPATRAARNARRAPEPAPPGAIAASCDACWSVIRASRCADTAGNHGVSSSAAAASDYERKSKRLRGRVECSRARAVS